MNAPRPSPLVHRNRLLASLSNEDYEHLRPYLSSVTLPYKSLLYAANRPIQSVDFIETGVASLVNTMENGDAAEVGTIGNEGIVGLPVILGDTQAPTSVYMQVAGVGLRMPAKPFLEALHRSTSMRIAILHYVHAFFNQVAQCAACNTFHNLDQRCCRWLLMTRERMQSNEFTLTHEFLAMMLGVRRSGVSTAASALKKAGIIRYSYGKVTILDPKALEKRSCECYRVTRDEFDRLLGTGSGNAFFHDTAAPVRNNLYFRAS